MRSDAERKKALSQVKGVFYAAISSASFGFSPLFSLMILAYGFNNFDVLTYRWAVAALGLLIIAIIKKKKLIPTKDELWKIIVASILRSITSITLLLGYINISSGVASTINFMYPVVVAICMMLFMGEKKSFVTMGAIALSIIGVLLMAGGDDIKVEGGNTVLGLVCSFISLFAYAAYFIVVKAIKADKIEGMKFTTWMMGLSALYFLVCALIFEGGVSFSTEPAVWTGILGLALWATMVSNFSTVKAIRRIGPTLTSVLGVLQPVTAVILGAIFLDEHFTIRCISGIIIILIAVSIIVTHQTSSR